MRRKVEAPPRLRNHGDGPAVPWRAFTHRRAAPTRCGEAYEASAYVVAMAADPYEREHGQDNF
ncbi:MAG TPA: hypothetical protein VK447_01250 [Myxococcaceae bacterium]|nr:hypothetical protein [Myxococcaceae bacterium]